MKKPKIIRWFPLDRKIEDGGGLWFYLPEWLVRAYKLKTINMMGRVMFTIREDKRAYGMWKSQESNLHEYWKHNWKNKMKKQDTNGGNG